MASQNRIGRADRQFPLHPPCHPAFRGTVKHHGAAANWRRLQSSRGTWRVALLWFFPHPEWQEQKANARAAEFGPFRLRGWLSSHFSRRTHAILRPFLDSVWPVVPSLTQRDQAAHVQAHVRRVYLPQRRRHFRCRARCALQNIRRDASFARGTEESHSARQRIAGRGELGRHTQGTCREYVWQNRKAWHRAAVSILRLQQRLG